jgi:hypothetical protein
MAAAQAGKYASVNGDGRTAAHAMDLATEIGSALSSGSSDGLADVSRGLLDELAQLVETVAERVECNSWSVCPCGEPHEQGDIGEKVVFVMRADAVLARSLRRQSER